MVVGCVNTDQAKNASSKTGYRVPTYGWVSLRNRSQCWCTLVCEEDGGRRQITAQSQSWKARFGVRGLARGIQIQLWRIGCCETDVSFQGRLEDERWAGEDCWTLLREMLDCCGHWRRVGERKKCGWVRNGR